MKETSLRNIKGDFLPRSTIRKGTVSMT